MPSTEGVRYRRSNYDSMPQEHATSLAILCPPHPTSLLRHPSHPNTTRSLDRPHYSYFAKRRKKKKTKKKQKTLNSSLNLHKTWNSIWKKKKSKINSFERKMLFCCRISIVNVNAVCIAVVVAVVRYLWILRQRNIVVGDGSRWIATKRTMYARSKWK